MKALVTCLLLLVVLCCTAQKVKLEFYTIEDGLESGSCSNLVQDVQGFMWLVSGGKLQRFDGTSFTTHPLPPQYKNNYPLELFTATFQDSLIFVFHKRAAFLFNPSKATWQYFPAPITNGEPHEFVGWEPPTPQGICLASRVKSLNNDQISIWLFDETGFQKQILTAWKSDFNKSYNYARTKDKQGNQYLLHGATLSKISPEETLIKKIEVETPAYNRFDLLYFNEVGRLVYMRDNRFFSTTLNLDLPRPHPINLLLEQEQINITSFRVEENGDIWLHGKGRNLAYYDVDENRLYNFTAQVKEVIPHGSILFTSFKDRSGTIWVSSALGILKVHLKSYPFEHYFTGISKDQEYFSFRGLSEGKNGKIYGTSYQDIVEIDPKTKRTRSLVAAFDRRNLAFDIQALGKQVITSNNKLTDISTKNTAPKTIKGRASKSHETSIFVEDEEQQIWIALPNKLFYLDQSLDELKWIFIQELPISDKGEVGAFHFGETSKLLWIGSLGQLFAYNRTTKKIQTFDKQNWKIPFNRIMTIEEDKSGKLWLATDIGLVQFDPATNQSKHYSVNEGLPNNFVCSLLTEGDSCIWMGTNHGLSRFHIQEETFINFFEEDGISYNEFNRMSYLKAKNGQLFFGGLRGVNAFDPKKIIEAYSRKNSKAKVVLSAFEHVDERQDSLMRQYNFEDEAEIHLYHWDRSFSFEYALTDYSNPEEIHYSYKMEGYEDLWSAARPFNFTRFSSLPSGQYTFRVRARDSHGLWHPNELGVKVIVHPPWWFTTWAYLAYALSLLIVFYGIFSFLKKRWLLRSQLKIEQAEAQRLKELDTFKTRLYTNLTHEFRTPLTVILGMAQQIKEHPKEHLETGLQLIENNGQNLQCLINQLLDLSKLEDKSFQLKLEQNDILPYLRYITESFQTYSNGRNLSIQFLSTTNSLVMDYDPEQIKQVMTNLLSNAIKFTASGGNIQVLVSATQKQLEIIVKDTGIGIATKNLPHIFDRFYQVDSSMTRKGEGTGIGLAHTQELIRLMDGTISVQSTIGKGTAFTIVLPIVVRKTLGNRTTTTYPSIENPILPPPIPIIKEVAHTKSSSQLPCLLIIEDSPDVVIYLKACLNDQYQIDVAYNGKIGIQKALENIPDLIISDVMMPEKNGYEVCNTLKSDARTSHIPITLLTAKADIHSKIEGLRTGADAYLAKPFHKRELEVRLQLMVEKQRKLSAYFSQKTQNLEEVHLPNIISEPEVKIEHEFIQKIAHILEAHYTKSEFGLPQLCQKIGMSRSQLYRKMKALIGVSPSQYIRTYRLKKAKHLLETSDLNVSEVAWDTGFSNLTHFAKIYKEEFGFSPSDSKRQVLNSKEEFVF